MKTIILLLCVLIPWDEEIINSSFQDNKIKGAL